MGLNKKYDGYKAYQYIPKEQYKQFDLVEESGWVEPYYVPLTPEQEARCTKLMAESVVISMHEHPCLFPKDMTLSIDYKHEGRQPMAYKNLSESCLDAVFDNLMDGTCVITSKAGWKWNDIVHDIGMRLCDMAQQNFVIRGETVADIQRAHDEGKLACVMCLEGPAPIENEIDRIDVLYGFGVRQMGIAYSQSSLLGGGLKEPRDGGLTTLGYEAVERMNNVGMAIDCSHAGDLTTADTIKASKKPILITHVGARALWDSSRLKGDDVLKELASKGGVIGVEAAPHTTITLNTREHSIYSIMEHFEYIKDLVGIDHVSFGPDTLYGDHVGLHNAFAGHLSIKHTQGKEEFPHVTHVKGMENPTEASINIVRWLVSKNYSDVDIKKIVGGNTMRALKEIWR